MRVTRHPGALVSTAVVQQSAEHSPSQVVSNDMLCCPVLWCLALLHRRAWAGLSHHAVVHAVCVKRQQLQFPSEAPEALVMLGQACMSAAPEERPTFEDILEVLGACRSYVRSTLC